MKAVSIVMHPLLMPAVVFAVLFYFAPLVMGPLPKDVFPILLLVVLLTTCLIPILSLIMLKATNFISSYYMEERADRILPFSFITIFYVLTSYLFFNNDSLNTIFVVILSIITGLVFSLTIVTFFYKISIHSAGVAGLAGFIMAINYKFPGNPLLGPIVLTILSAGLVMSSRLYLNSHKPREVLTGCLLGFSISYLGIIMFA